MGKLVSVTISVSIAFFAIGLIAVIALFVTPLLAGGAHAPTWVYLMTMLAPLGFILGIIAVVAGGRVRDS